MYEGEFYEGIYNGKGKAYNYSGFLVFEGEYLEGKRWNGKGKEYNDDNELLFKIEYINGEEKEIIK